MKIGVWFIALPCMGAELYSKWLCFPLSRQLRGFQFSLLGYASDAHRFALVSYGFAAALCCAFAAIGLAWRRPRILCLSGVFLLWLSALSILQPACMDARLLNEMASEMDQQVAGFAFSQAALPVNTGAEPSVWPRLTYDTLAERLVAAWYFSHFGSWFAYLLGFIALGCGIAVERRFFMGWVAIGGFVALTIACTLRPAYGEWFAARARAAEARGEPDDAIRLYRRQISTDHWVAINLAAYERIGAIDGNYNRTGTVEFHIYHAELPSTQVDITKSIAELQAQLPRAQEPLASALRKRVAELLTQHARALHAFAAYGAAAAECENALHYNPRAILPAFYVSREYFLVGAYRDAISTAVTLGAKVDDPTIRANIYANLGDAYTKLGAFDDAKRAYRKSYLYDYLLNLRGLSAVAGP